MDSIEIDVTPELEQALTYSLTDHTLVTEMYMAHRQDSELECPVCEMGGFKSIALGDSGFGLVPKLFDLELSYIKEHITKEQAIALQKEHVPVATDMVE